MLDRTGHLMCLLNDHISTKNGLWAKFRIRSITTHSHLFCLNKEAMLKIMRVVSMEIRKCPKTIF